MGRLAGKTAVVTGGVRGIGAATVTRFRKEKCKVHVLDLKKGEEEEVTYHVCDIGNKQAVQRVFTGLEHVDILVNNAGIAHIGKIEDTSEADLDHLYEINIKGLYNCVHAALQKMNEGVIINLASVAGSVGLSDRFAYSMTKGAVLSMTYSIARDYIHRGIRCNSVSPARVHTPFVDEFLHKNYQGKEQEMFEKLSASQPLGRMGTPDEIAGLITYLSSDEASFITGTDFPIDGGFIRLNS